jgi:hypothetical protein
MYIVRRPVTLLVLVLVVGSAAFVTTRARGADKRDNVVSNHQAPGHLHHRPGSIIGKETPEAIPDDVAYHMMMRLMGGLEDAPDGAARVKSYIEWVERHSKQRFEKADAVVLQLIARSHRAQLNDTERNVKSGQISTNAAKAARQHMVRDSVARLSSELTPHGQAVLEHFVQLGVKPRMKVLR